MYIFQASPINLEMGLKKNEGLVIIKEVDQLNNPSNEQ